MSLGRDVNSAVPNVCYFCNKQLINETQEGHSTTCASVLEPCVNKCGSYVPRSERERHQRKCKNNIQRRSTPLLDSVDGSSTSFPNGATDGFSTTRKASSTHAPEIAHLTSRVNNINAVLTQVTASVNVLKSSHQQLRIASNHPHDQCREKLQNVTLQLGKIQYSCSQLMEWKHAADKNIAALQQEAFQASRARSTIGRLESQIHDLAQRVDVLTHDGKQRDQAFHSEQIATRDLCNDIRADLNEFKDFHVQENATVSALWMDQRLATEKLAQDVVKMGERVDEILSKYTALNFEVISVKRIATDAADTMQFQQEQLQSVQQNLSQFQLDLDTLADLYSSCRNVANGPPGRLVWRITDFKLKLQNAVDEQTVLRSPYFYTTSFGYKIQLQMHLNGLKKWKGRYLIAYVHVLNGEYDDLMKWPCFIEGNIILKDLNTTEPKHIAKYISAKRRHANEKTEEPQESSTEYVFIPHSTLFKETFTRSDTIYFEIEIFKSERRETII